MTELIQLTTRELRANAAAQHTIAEELAAESGAHVELTSMLDALGPVFADLRDAGRMLLDQRASCYQQLAAIHGDLSDKLTHAAQEWEGADGDAASRLRTFHERP